MSATENVNIDNGSNEELTGEALLKRLFKELNNSVHNREEYFTKAHHVTYHMVAKMVEVAEKCETDPVFANALQDLAAERKVPLPDAEKDENPYLHIARLADGKWVDPAPRSPSAVKRWVWNRSNEKHAGAIRFFMENETHSSKVFELLTGKAKIVKKGGGKIKPTLNAVMAADRAEHGTGRTPAWANAPSIWTADVREDAEELEPVLAVKADTVTAGAFTWAEDDYSIAVVRRVGDEIQVLGDAGMEGNAVLKIVKNRTKEMKKKHASILQMRKQTKEIPYKPAKSSEAQAHA